MKFRTVKRPGNEPVIVPVFEGATPRGYGREFAEAKKRDRFTGAAGSTARAGNVLFAGLGKRAEVDGDRLRAAAGAGARALRREPTVTILLPGAGDDEAHAAAVGAGLALYDFDRYKTKKDPPALRTIQIAGKGDLRRAEIYVRAACLARDLVNEPAGVMTPRRLADEARKVRGVKCRVFDEREIARRGMAGLRNVSLGSGQPPRFVHLAYRAPGAKRTVALVGKGITFDAGGLDLKSADSMATMKDDMAGAGNVIAIMSALPALKPRVNVHGIFAATENLPGQWAYKPGDVITYANRKTVEVTNTDAEGRLVLADALIYASALKPDVIVDMATLTGACMVALGPDIAGLFTANDRLSRDLIGAGMAEGEWLWRLPLFAPYLKAMESKIAHMVNAGRRPGGAINAAVFLREFVGEGIDWAHIDIAGPAFGDGGPYAAHGGSGFGVRTLLRYLEG